MNYRLISRSNFFMAASLAIAILAGWCRAGEPESSQQAAAGKLDRTAVLAELQDYSLRGVDRRLGPDYAACHRQGPAEKLPQVWMAPARQEPGGRSYQIGGPWTRDAGDFSSTQGQILYVPDAGFFPVDRVTIIEWSNGCFTEAPCRPGTAGSGRSRLPSTGGKPCPAGR